MTRGVFKTRNLIVLGALGITSGFVVMSLYSVVYPAYHLRQVKRALIAEAVAALPPGAVVEEQGVTGAGSLDGYAIGRMDLSPAQVLALRVTPGGTRGWVTPIPNCGPAELCWLSRGKDHILTWKVAPCQRVDCPTRSSLVTADVARGGPNS
ncbi:MAG: hypothetical protein M3N21_00615 [Actinomycetota bacterium]|nr:hypothetical protein [Actinomycetota bacterium]